MNESWISSISQKRKGDPRLFLKNKDTQNALWASSDVYQRNRKTKKDAFTRVDSTIISATDHVSKGLDALFGTDGFQIAVYRDDSNLNNNLTIAFEGTNTASTVWKDIQLYQSTKSPFSPGKIHSGFLSLYQSSKPYIQSILDRYPGANVTFTGHSLGGAIASIATADEWPAASIKAVTFGAPQVGDQEFSTWFQKSGKTLDRVVQKSDPIVVGNLNFNHMTEDAWVIGNDTWMSREGHSISNYMTASDRVNSDLSSLSTDTYVYPYAKTLIDAINTGKTISKAIDYYKYAQELYQLTQIASGLPQTTNTLKNVLFTDRGVLNRAYETTIDSLSKIQAPTKADFRSIFEERVLEVKQDLERLDRATTISGPEYTQKTNASVYGIEPKLKPSNLDDLAASLQSKIPAEAPPVPAPIDPKSNFANIVKGKIADVKAKYPVLETSLTNIKKAGNWIDTTLRPARSALGKLAGGAGVISTLQHLTSKDLTVSDIPELALETINSALVVHEALSYAGIIQGIETGSFIAGISIPSMALFASSVGLLSIAGYEILNKIKKGLYGDLGGSGTLNSMQGVRARGPSAEQAVLNDYLVTVHNQAMQLGIQIPENFFEESISKIEFKKGKIRMKDRKGELEDLLFPPIDGIHASSGDLYREYSLKHDVYDYLKSNGKLGELSFKQFDARHHGEFSIQSNKVLYDNKPFEDYFLPPVYLDGQQILPSTNLQLYNNVLTLQSSLSSLLPPEQVQGFISKYAKSTQVVGDVIMVDGKNLKDVVMPPIEGVKFSESPDQYNKALLTLFLYQGLEKESLVQQDFKDFFVKYFASVHTDDEGNILLENDEPASSFPFLPVTSPDDGTLIYKIDNPPLYNKIRSFEEHQEELLMKLNNMTYKKVPKEKLWSLYKDSLVADGLGNLAFGMAPEEVSTFSGQMRVMDHLERVASALDIVLDNSYYQTRQRMERTNIPIKMEVEAGQIVIDGVRILDKFSSPFNTSSIPDVVLSSVAGQWTKGIGVLYGKEQAETVESKTAPPDYKEQKDAMTREEQVGGLEQLENLVHYNAPVVDLKQKALESLFMQFLMDGRVDISEEDFYKIYGENTVFVDGVLRTKDGSLNIPEPVVRHDAQGNEVLQLEDPERYAQLDLTHKIYDQLVLLGKEKESGRSDFIDAYEERLGVSNGDFGDEGAGITLDGESVGSYNTADPINGLMYNPLESVESKLASVSPEVVEDQGGSDAVQNYPGVNGFRATGQQLDVMQLKDTWYIIFENSERDSYMKRRNLGGFTILGNWVGSSPLSNGPPLGILDSYFLAYHIQKRHNKDTAKNFLNLRINKALEIGTIHPKIDVREFELATRVVDLPETSDVFDIEKMQDTSSSTLEACLQRNWNEVAQASSWGSPSLPPHVSDRQLQLVPPYKPSEPLLKRTIEAAGILNDVAAQSKLRKVYGDFIEARKFSEKYMQLIQVASRGTLTPRMDRIEMEGRLAKDEMQDVVAKEMVQLLYTPLLDFFK
jgi:hypothetical protein